MEKVFKSAAIALCLSATACSPPVSSGYVQVDDAYVAKLPPEPITAIIGGDPRARVSVQVESVAACVATSRNMAATASDYSFGAASFEDNAADCIDRKGAIALIIDKGILYAKKAIPDATP